MSTVNELHSLHVAGNTKYTYFVLAATGAAVGFAVQKTEGLSLSWWLLPVGMATMFWAVSFGLGCRSVGMVQRSIAANITMIQVQDGTFHVRASRAAEAEAAEKLQKQIIDFGDKAADANTGQFVCFALGALCFLAWRVAEMIRIS